jgi:hypothetical protein
VPASQHLECFTLPDQRHPKGHIVFDGDHDYREQSWR